MGDRPTQNALALETTGGGATPHTVNVAITLANTEYSYTFPVGTRRFSLKLRASQTAKLYLSTASDTGQSGITYLTLPPDCEFSEQCVDSVTGVTLFFQSPTATQVAEITYWTQ